MQIRRTNQLAASCLPHPLPRHPEWKFQSSQHRTSSGTASAAPRSSASSAAVGFDDSVGMVRLPGTILLTDILLLPTLELTHAKSLQRQKASSPTFTLKLCSPVFSALPFASRIARSPGFAFQETRRNFGCSCPGFVVCLRMAPARRWWAMARRSLLSSVFLNSLMLGSL